MRHTYSLNPGNETWKAGKLLLFTLLSAGLMLAAIPTGNASSILHTSQVTGTLTASGPGCNSAVSVIGAVEYILTPAGPTVVAAHVNDRNTGRTLTLAQNNALYTAPDEEDDDCPFIQTSGITTQITAAVNCPSNSISISWPLGGDRVISFSSSAGGLCLGNNVTPVAGPRANPTPASIQQPVVQPPTILPPEVQPPTIFIPSVQTPTYPGPVLGCVGTVVVVLVTGTTVTLPAFSPNCQVSELCAPFLQNPAVVSCTPSLVLPMTQVYGPQVHEPTVTPPIVHEPVVHQPVFHEPTYVPLHVGCLYDQAFGVDVNDDGIAEFSQTIRVFDTTPCP